MVEKNRVIIGKIFKGYSSLDTCEHCGRGGKIEDHRLILAAVRESRETVKAEVSIMKDLFLVFKNYEFQQKVLQAIDAASPEVKRAIVMSLEENKSFESRLLN